MMTIFRSFELSEDQKWFMFFNPMDGVYKHLEILIYTTS